MARRLLALSLAILAGNGMAMAQTPSASTPPGVKIQASPCRAPQSDKGGATPSAASCRTDAPPGPNATNVAPGAGVMLTSPTGMMTDPGHQPMPNAAPTGKPKS